MWADYGSHPAVRCSSAPSCFPGLDTRSTREKITQRLWSWRGEVLNKLLSNLLKKKKKRIHLQYRDIAPNPLLVSHMILYKLYKTSMNLIFLIYKMWHKTCKSYCTEGLEEKNNKTLGYVKWKILYIHIFFVSQPHILG